MTTFILRACFSQWIYTRIDHGKFPSEYINDSLMSGGSQ